MLNALLAIALLAPRVPVPSAVDGGLQQLCSHVLDALSTAENESRLTLSLSGARIGVYPFDEPGQAQQRIGRGDVVADALERCLRASNRLQVHEVRHRTRLLEATRYIKVLDNDPEASRNALALFDLDLMIFGSITPNAEQYVIHPRIVERRTGKQHHSASGRLPKAEFDDIVPPLVRPRKGVAAALSLLPGVGQYYNGERTKAWLMGGGTWALAAGSLTLHLLGNDAQAQYRTGLRIHSDDGARAEDFWMWRNGLAIGSALLWAYGIFDAYRNGYEYDPLVRPPVEADTGRVGR